MSVKNDLDVGVSRFSQINVSSQYTNFISNKLFIQNLFQRLPKSLTCCYELKAYLKYYVLIVSNKTFLGLYTQDFLTSGQKKLQVALGTCQTICLCDVIATARLDLFCQNLNKR